MIASLRNSVLRSGATRLGISKRYIVWLYVVSLFLGFAGTASLASRLGHVLDRSLYSDRLVHGFDLGAWLDLIDEPGTAMGSQVPTSVLLSIAFVLFQVFLTGGIVTEYLAGARLARSRFYSACGENFWKLIRLAIFFVIVGGIIAAIVLGIRTGIGNAMGNSPHEHRKFAVQFVIVVVEALILLWVRMWFDLAQAHSVATGESAVRRSIGRASSMARAGSLYGRYIVLTILMLLVIGLGGYFWWTVVPAPAVFLSFLVLQLIMFCLLALRWWQRAAAAAWYDFHVPPPQRIAPPEPLIDTQVPSVDSPVIFEPPIEPTT